MDRLSSPVVVLVTAVASVALLLPAAFSSDEGGQALAVATASSHDGAGAPTTRLRPAPERRPSASASDSVCPLPAALGDRSLPPRRSSGGDRRTSLRQGAAGAAQGSPCGGVAKVASDVWQRYEKATRASGCLIPWKEDAAQFRACALQAARAGPGLVDQMIEFWNSSISNRSFTIGTRRLYFGEPNKGTLAGTGAGILQRRFVSTAPQHTGSVELSITKRTGKLETVATVCAVRPNGHTQVLGHTTFDSKPQGALWQKSFSLNQPSVLAVHFESTKHRPPQDWQIGQKFAYEVTYEPEPAKVDTGSVSGFADLHLHQMAAHGFAGLWYWPTHTGPMKPAPKAHPASPFSQMGVPVHAIPEGLVSKKWPAKEINHGQPRPGELSSWPLYNDIAHQQAYADWLQNAHRNGLNLVVVSAVNFQPFCHILRWVHPNRHGDWSCEDMAAVRRQLKAAHRMDKNYDWYRIAVNPWHARQIIHEGDLAVVLSMEVSTPLSAGPYMRQLDKYWGMGLRSMQIVHETNSQFAGAAPHRKVFAIAEELKHPSVPIPERIDRRIGVVSNETGFDTGPNGKNLMGLTAEGEQVLEEMIDRHMLIDVAHLSERAVRQVYESVARPHDYYPLYDSHTHLKGILPDKMRRKHKEFLTTCEQARYIEKTGGMVGLRTGLDSLLTARGPVGNTCHGSARSYAQLVDFTVNQTGLATGIGSDLNGLATQLGPRFTAPSQQNQPAASRDVCPLGGSSDGIASGAFDRVGLSHVGYLPALLNDLDQLGAQTGRLRRSAEAFLTMWERTYQENRSAKSVATDCPFASHHVVVNSTGIPGATRYSLQPAGSLHKVSRNLQGIRVSTNPSDKVQNRRAEGQVDVGADAYGYTGRLTAFRADNPTAVDLLVDGSPTHMVVIDSRDQPGQTEYTIKASSGIEQVTGPFQGISVTKGTPDRVSGSTAQGRVSSGADGFRVHGELPYVTLTNPSAATVRVNGAEYHTIVIQGGKQETDYTVRVEGYLEAATDLVTFYGGNEMGDQVSGQRATGSVQSEADAYRVAGQVELIEPAGGARIEVDGKPYHTLVLKPRNRGASASYEFRVSGQLRPVSGTVAGVRATIDRPDTVSGNRAHGRLQGGADAYWYTGSVTSVSVPNRSAVDIYDDGTRLRDRIGYDPSAPLRKSLNRAPLNFLQNLPGAAPKGVQGNLKPPVMGGDTTRDDSTGGERR